MKVLILVSWMLLTASCNNSDPMTSSEEIAMSAPGQEPMESDAKMNSISVPQKVIREGQLRFETNDLDKSYSQIRNAVAKYGGAIENDVQGKDYESIFRHITVRVPSAKFEAFVADAGKGVTYFDRKEISARDVTEEFIDIEARLHAKKTLEARYLELLKKANKVSEILEIEKQLSVIREEIESKEGQMKYLENRISLSTITIEIYKRTATEIGMTTSYGGKMWNAIVSGFNGFSGFLISLLYIWPFILILGVVFFILRNKFRKRKLL